MGFNSGFKGLMRYTEVTTFQTLTQFISEEYKRPTDTLRAAGSQPNLR